MDIRHICMVDDDPDDYYLFTLALKEVNASIQITWFKNGKALLTNLYSNNGTLPDLILLDMNMPGINGLECLQKIKEDSRFKLTPVVIFSTASTPAIIKRAYESGAVKYLLKPHSIEGLTTVIKEILAIL